MQGFLNLNKPGGMTSHDCVSRCRRLLKMSRIGHGGTLDPAATGVLPIALGKATKLLQFLPDNKAYHGTIKFGVTTNTDDLDGDILTSQPCPHLNLADIEAILPNFLGTISQIPPNYSAIQVGGKRLYDLARKGELIEVPSREVQIFNLTILEWRSGDFPELDLAIVCGPGTYIRSLARDLGQHLKVGATLAQLTRTLSNGFILADSLTFEQLENALKNGTFQPQSPTISLQHLPRITLNPVDSKRWCYGQRLVWENSSPGNALTVYNEIGDFLGISEIITENEANILVPKLVFA